MFRAFFLLIISSFLFTFCEFFWYVFYLRSFLFIFKKIRVKFYNQRKSRIAVVGFFPDISTTFLIIHVPIRTIDKIKYNTDFIRPIWIIIQTKFKFKVAHTHIHTTQTLIVFKKMTNVSFLKICKALLLEDQFFGSIWQNIKNCPRQHITTHQQLSQLVLYQCEVFPNKHPEILF